MSAVCGYCETDIDPIDNVDGYCSKRCKELSFCKDFQAVCDKYGLYIMSVDGMMFIDDAHSVVYVLSDNGDIGGEVIRRSDGYKLCGNP